METFEPKVFISCHPKDKEGEFYKALFRSLNERGLDVVDDTRGMGYKDSIREFIERVGRAACVVLVLSDSYLRERSCILQLVEVAKNEKFRERIFPVDMGDTAIYEPLRRTGYVKYWEEKRTELAEALRSLDPANLQGLREDMDENARFRDRISGIISSLADMNALTPDKLRESDFGILHTAIDKQLQIARAEALSRDPEEGPLADWGGGSPYPGLLNFEIEDAPIFFGRWVETEALIRRLENPDCHFLAVVGASGSGKSSLVKAGLLARLRDGQAGKLRGTKDWLIAAFKPNETGHGPFDALAKILKQPLRVEPGKFSRELEENPGQLREALEKYLQKGSDTKRVLLVIDQFEELFTLVDADLREKFLRMLKDMTGSERTLTVVTMRNDFFRYCSESDILKDLINLNSNSTYTLTVPGPVEMHKMIVKPARAAGLFFEPGLDRWILDDTGHDPGALALMAFALKLLYDESGDSRLMTSETYKRIGRVQGAIGMHAAETFKDLPQEAQEALPRVFRGLLTVDENGTATRQRARKEQVAKDEASRSLMERLIENRLLVTSSNDELVEVAHEALFRSWPELAEWIERTKDHHVLLRQVRAAAAEWYKQKDDALKPKFLWPDERLKLVYAMEKSLEPAWEPHEKEFIRSEAERILEELDKPETDHKHRSWIGERLDTIGDPRPGVGLVEGIVPLKARELPEGEQYAYNELKLGEIRLWGDRPEHKGLPDIVWLPVRGGTIQIEGQTFTVHHFYIAKYPITYTQFGAFSRNGYGLHFNYQWWDGLWVNDEQISFSGNQKFQFINSPREKVSWYDSIAFCRWLNAHLEWPELPADFLTIRTLETFKCIRLPTEWEWQWAATGGNPDYKYPWGTEWDLRKANTSESGLGRTTAVGMYPAGSAQCGALDLSGNIWEWCLNEYSGLRNIGLSGGASRVVRGGSWDYRRDGARTSYRSGDYEPFNRSDNLGFRLVVRPPSL